jgi:hypothetical protein
MEWFYFLYKITWFCLLLHITITITNLKYWGNVAQRESDEK